MKHILAIALSLLIFAGNIHAQNDTDTNTSTYKSYFGGGMIVGGTSLCQKGTPTSFNTPGIGWGLNFEYTYLFSKVMGVQTGLTLMSGKSTFSAGYDYEYFSDVIYPDPMGTDWTIHYKYVSNGHEEISQFTQLHIPLMLRIDTRSFVASIGMKAAIPIGPVRIKYKSGTTDVAITQIDPTDNINIPAQLLGAKHYDSESGGYTFRSPVWIMGAAELGFRINMKVVGLRPSLYVEYALNNGASTHDANMKQLSYRDLPIATTTNTLTYSNCMNNNLVQKMHYLSFGFRMTLDFGPGLYGHKTAKKDDNPLPIINKSEAVPNAEDLMVFIRKTNGQQQYYGSYGTKDKWATAVAMLQLGDPAERDNVSYTVSPDGKITIMALEGDGGMGGKDLYYSVLRNGQWSEPRNLGSHVNCHTLDDQPAFSADGRTLYFVSDRSGGLGGSDIWFTNLQNDMTWSTAENAGTAVNSSGDERTPVFYNNRLYFASNGRDGNGGYDIYYVVFSPLNGATGVPINVGGNVNTKDDELGILTLTNVSRTPNGNTTYFIPPMPYNNQNAAYSATLQPAYNVLFRIGSASITPEYVYSIKQIADLIISNHLTRVEVGGHTDNTGSENRNILLSWDRAKAVYYRLIAYGVPAERLTYHGYGASLPIISNSTEEGRAINRRVEFKIIGNE